MTQVNMLEAKTNLSRLIHTLELREEDAIVIARGNKPVAKITLIEEQPATSRIGIAKGKIFYTDAFDECDLKIAELFGVET